MDYLGGAGFAFKIVEWLARLFACVRNRREEKLENKILEHIAQNPDWSSPKSFWAEEYFRTVKGFPMPPALPVETLRGWAKCKWRSRWFLFEARHRWRKFVNLVPEGQVANVMRHLCKQGLVERAPLNGEFYRLKR